MHIDDVRQDLRYGKNPSHHGMPNGHLPGISHSREVLGGLFCHNICRLISATYEHGIQSVLGLSQ